MSGRECCKTNTKVLWTMGSERCMLFMRAAHALLLPRCKSGGHPSPLAGDP
jgi:hypothetical protein